MGRRRHDLAVTWRISLIPMVIIAVTQQHGVDMAIPKPRQHVHPFGRNHFCIRRHFKLAHSPVGGDALVLNDDHTVGQWVTTEAVNKAAAHDSEWPRLRRGKDKTENKRSDKVCVHDINAYAICSVLPTKCDEINVQAKSHGTERDQSKVTSSIQNQASDKLNHHPHSCRDGKPIFPFSYA